MADITLLLALHNHQPVGNFGSVFEVAWERCYWPVLKAFYEAPTVKVSLHHTGPLLEWLDAHRPEYLDCLREMAARGQVEILGGGFYEPMLSVLPERDAVGQIRKMADWSEGRLGVRPRGMWLAERVWEPDLARIIAEGGMEYTLLDDTHFFSAGMTERPMHGSFLTEKAGAAIRALPISQELRYALPFQPVEETIAALRRIADETGRQNIALTYGDDGEKFGLWPDTYAWVFEKGWLADFLAALQDNAGWLATSTISSYLDANAARGLVYLPTASYEEMGHWALPPEAGQRFDDFRHALADEGRLEANRPFVRGGIWQGFLTRYPESNAIHKRMLRASGTLEALRRAGGAEQVVAEAEGHLYKAQCNCAYWHGLFGGIYLNWLRAALYNHLYRAEALIDEAAHGPTYRLCTVEDIDLDGRDEVVIDTPEVGLVIAPALGGAIRAISLRRHAFNPTDVLTRRIEGFHRLLDRAVVMDRQSARAMVEGEEDGGKPKSIHDLVLAKEPDLKRLVIEDPTGRFCAVDAIYPTMDPVALVDQLARGVARASVPIYGERFALEGVREGATLEVAMRARVPVSHIGVGLVVDKRVVLSEDQRAFDLAYDLSAVTTVSGLFTVAFNLTLLAPDAPDRTLQIDGGAPRAMNTCGAQAGGEALMTDGWQRLALRLSSADPADILYHPIETVSQSEDGFERTYQGTNVTFCWPIMLLAGQRERFLLSFEVIPATDGFAGPTPPTGLPDPDRVRLHPRLLCFAPPGL